MPNAFLDIKFWLNCKYNEMKSYKIYGKYIDMTINCAISNYLKYISRNYMSFLVTQKKTPISWATGQLLKLDVSFLEDIQTTFTETTIKKPNES